MNLAVNNTSLFLAAMLVLVALGISLWRNLAWIGTSSLVSCGCCTTIYRGLLAKVYFPSQQFVANAGDDGLHYLQCGLECEKTGAGD